MLHEFVERLFARVPTGRVAKVVREGDSLGEVFVDSKGAGDVAGDGGHFHRVREARAQVLTATAEEDLRFVFQPPKRTGVDDAVAVALKPCAPLGRPFGKMSSS